MMKMSKMFRQSMTMYEIFHIVVLQRESLVSITILKTVKEAGAELCQAQEKCGMKTRLSPAEAGVLGRLGKISSGG